MTPGDRYHVHTLTLLVQHKKEKPLAKLVLQVTII